ncbi:MAG: DUF6444 domain-containing protein [Pseudomonadota bacterium]
MGINSCPLCLDKQRRIDELEDEVKSLKQKLGKRERKDKDGYFGSSTPSSKKPVKPNAEKKEKKRVGARPGHKGNGRKSHTDKRDRIVNVAAETEICPDCLRTLQNKGTQERSVLDTAAAKPEKILFRLPKKYCPHCRKSFTPQAPGVLPKSLYGNQLIANAGTSKNLNIQIAGVVVPEAGRLNGPASVPTMPQRMLSLYTTTGVSQDAQRFSDRELLRAYRAIALIISQLGKDRLCCHKGCRVTLRDVR